MLWPDDQLLVERDRRLPGLPLLFDPAALAGALRERFGAARIDAARLTYVRYKPRTSCLASYQLDTSAGCVDAYALAYPAGENEKLAKGVDEARPGVLGPGAIVLPEACIAFHVFPNDVRLNALAELGRQESLRQLLQKLLPSHPKLWDGTVTRLAYKPHRRYVAMLAVDGEPQAVMKFYTRGGFDAAIRNARAIQATEHLRLPRRMGRSNRHAIAVYRWIEGTPLGPVTQMTPSMLQGLGSAVREIHQQEAADLPLIDGAGETARLRAIASALGAVLPRLEQRALLAAQGLIDSFPEPQTITPIHGDLHAKQVLLSHRKYALLDLDEAARSSPLADLGNFIAHLHRNAIAIGAGEEQVYAAGQALLAGYGLVPTVRSERELTWHTAASLLRLTPHPFRVRDHDWAARTEAMLARVESLLATIAPAPRSVIPLVDPFDVVSDEKLARFARAATGAAVCGHFSPRSVRGIRVVRHKAARRCILEYDLSDDSVAIGKIRAKGADRSTHRLLRSLREAGFDEGACDGITVPEPLGVIESCGLWLQRKVPGTPATELLCRPGGPRLAQRIAEAIVKLHRAGVAPRRRHTIEDELHILRQRLEEVVRDQPQWEQRIAGILDACETLAGTLPPPRTCGILRDCYADHVLVSPDGRLCLIDLDLYCEGDCALDAGNFLAHITEQSLRDYGDAAALLHVERALEERFLELSGASLRQAVRVYRSLTLARHIAISRRLAPRRHLTAALLDLCEQDLGLAAKAGMHSVATA